MLYVSYSKYDCGGPESKPEGLLVEPREVTSSRAGLTCLICTRSLLRVSCVQQCHPYFFLVAGIVLALSLKKNRGVGGGATSIIYSCEKYNTLLSSCWCVCAAVGSFSTPRSAVEGYTRPPIPHNETTEEAMTNTTEMRSVLVGFTLMAASVTVRQSP